MEDFKMERERTSTKASKNVRRQGILNTPQYNFLGRRRQS